VLLGCDSVAKNERYLDIMAVRIREVTFDDAPTIAAIYRPYVTATPISFETVPPDDEEMRDRVQRITEMYPWLVAEAPDGIVGYAYACRHRDRTAYQWAVDVSAYIAPTSQRQGLGRRLYSELFEIVKRQGFTNAFAGITLPNDASIGLHKAMGFELVGIYKNVGFKLGNWHDTSWWQLCLSDDPAAPRDPVSWREISG
jgi:L-amino acid N-acyltransferase YncA